MKNEKFDAERMKKYRQRAYPSCPKCRIGDMLQKYSRSEDGSESVYWKCSYCGHDT